MQIKHFLSGMSLAHPKVFLHSYGCQMNLYDGELVSSLLTTAGYSLTPHLDEAEVVLINTCSVRDHAEQRVLGRLRTLGALKVHRKMVIGVLGCMAQRLGNDLAELLPAVDFSLGPDAYRELPEILERQLNGGHGHWTYGAGDPDETYGEVIPQRRAGVNAYVAIMRGCNNFCTYCVVPYVRGRERSRNPDEILAEIERATEAGFPEITLLGQNVNSYRWDGLDFPDLLDRVAEIEGVERLRFLTSHPRDLNEKLIQRLARGGIICPTLHLPVQSGSDRILRLMGRGYTADQYLSQVRKLRERVAGLTLSTDLLCGFPSETEEEFQQTLNLIKMAHFDDAFTYKYSERPGTKATQLPDDVPAAVKIERLERLITFARQLADKSRRQMLGRNVEVLCESPSPRDESEWSGRTHCGRMALVPGTFNRGQTVKIKVEAVRGFSLWGRATGRQ